MIKMIDPHIHLRDWNQSVKETVKHGFYVAHKAGLNGVFEMPNTDPAMTSLQKIKDRIRLADKAITELDINLFHGLYAGLTPNPVQIKEMVDAYNELFPRVVGFKMFAGKSTGDLSIADESNQRLIYSTLAKLNYKGIIAVHCEKESLFKSEIWDPKKPETHSLARPPISETESVSDQLAFAKEEGFKGTLHIVHVSVPESLVLIENARKSAKFKITCGLTPHHALLNQELASSNDGILMKVNPPLRPKFMQQQMLKALFDGRIDWIETDHAPHSLKDKIESNASGFPGLAFYPKFIKYLKDKNMSEKMIKDLTHNNIVKAFNIKIDDLHLEPCYDLEKEYEFNAYKDINL
jgi:dihydroorotase